MPAQVGKGFGRSYAIGHQNVPNDKKRAKRSSKRNNMRKGNR